MKRILHIGILLSAFDLSIVSWCQQALVPAKRLHVDSKLAATPPMGWNSWDAFGLTIHEADFRANVTELAKLRQFGWNYAVIDEGWYMWNPADIESPEKMRYEIDSYGRYMPVPERFPSVSQDGVNIGLKPLAEYAHGLGMKFGIHIIRGIPKISVAKNSPIEGSRYTVKDAADTVSPCPWDPTSWGVKNTPAGQAWYDSLMRQYAGWGVDFLKVDCVSDHPYRPSEIKMIHKAIVRSGRSIVLSLSPGPTSPSLKGEIQPYAQMWRISDDIWDEWAKSTGVSRGVRDQFVLAGAWAPAAGPGSWPDADMLPFGYLGPNPGEGKARETKLTHDEQRSMMTLWSIARSPLILGANLTRLDEWTRALITNMDVLTLNQQGHNQHQVTREGNTVAWTSEVKGKMYLAIFNLNDGDKKVARRFDFYGFEPGAYKTRDLWSGEERAAAEDLQIKLAPHACILIELVKSASSR